MVKDVADTHWTAQYHQAVVSLDPGPRLGLAVEVHVVDAKAPLLEQGVQGSEDLEGDVLEDEEPAHAP